MKKFLICISLVCAGMMVSCVDKNEDADPDSKPEWLGGSIYSELKDPDQDMLSGSFNYYVRLVDDLGYAETLNRTGSKTVFPANDEAFERFFASNSWGISKYEQLTDAMKKQLLYSSMIDNALLVNMLSNVSSGSTSVTKGMAMKHLTSVNVIDSVTFLPGPAEFPQNNSYWSKYGATGIHYVSDNTRPMMIHFTGEHMLQNNISTLGDNSDFAVITGTPYEEGSAYVFRDKIIKSDVTCMNGYIQQMQDVIVPPGNMAQVIRESGETDLFSRILDRFAVPYYDAVTTQAYNSWALQNEKSTIDSIFQMRYLSGRSQAATLNVDPNGKTVSSDKLLLFDPGWNQYYPNVTSSSTDMTLSDVAAMFVPDDASLKKYFLPSGEGAFMIEQFGVKDNTEANLKDNIDAIPQYIMATFVNNLMKTSFVDAVPSKFSTIANTAAENMGMKLDYIKQNSDNTYDVKIANNGVIYVMNTVIMPDEYQAVSAPTIFNDALSVMRWAIDDKTIYNGSTTTASKLGLDFWAYLLAMSANYGLFLPDNDAFDAYCVDPVSLLSGQTPTGLHFYTISTSPFIACKRVSYNKNTHEFGQEINQTIDISNVSTQFADILNTHTVVLGKGETIGTNHYYMTKQGAAIYVSGGAAGDYVASGAQINDGLPKSEIEKVYNEKNGKAYRINHIIQTPESSVYATLKGNSNFSEFLELCEGFDAAATYGILEWLGYSNQVVSPATKSAQDQLKIFAPVIQTFTSGTKKQVSIDNNMNLFNSYHYTMYVPNNTAMNEAYNAGLPTWTEIQTLFDNNAYHGGTAESSAKVTAQAMINTIHEFIAYHIQSGYSFADKNITSGDYQTLLADANKQYYKLAVSGANGTLNVKDRAGITHTITAGSSQYVNRMARDYQFAYDSESDATPHISTSSYAVIHELSQPLYLYTTKRYDAAYKTNAAKVASVRRLNALVKK